MFLQLNHKDLDAYVEAKKVILECYKITRAFPSIEKFALVSQIRRAASSVLLNIAEGASRKAKTDRGRFYVISRSSLVELDAAFDIAKLVGYLEGVDLDAISKSVNVCFQKLTGMINSCNDDD